MTNENDGGVIMKKELNGVNIELITGDITNQPDCKAVVNAANAELMPGGGVAGAIHNAAGPELANECRPLAPISPGEAVITGGFNLPNPFVIHTLGPIYGIDKPEDKLLQNCYLNSLKVAEEKGLDSVAFPAISTGAFGYPIKPAAEIALRTLLEMTGNLKSVKSIRMVLFSQQDFEVHETIFKSLV